jgi:hypothetical protein
MDTDKALEFCIASFFYAAAAAVVAIVLFGGYAIVRSASSTGEVDYDYCYIDTRAPDRMAPQFLLYGHRNWRADNDMGSYPTADKTKEAADAVGCRIGVSK